MWITVQIMGRESASEGWYTMIEIDIWINEVGEWCRRCPECSTIIEHSGRLAKGNCAAAVRNGRKCKHCGPTWSEAARKKASLRSTGSQNPNYRHGKYTGRYLIYPKKKSL